MQSQPPLSVAIVGAGVQGLTMLKNLLDLNTPEKQLFEPVILESRDKLGGLWAFTEDPNVLTTLKTTLANTTRWRNCFSDFPASEAWRMGQANGDKRASVSEDDAFLDDTGLPVYATAAQFQLYLEMYAEKFNLNPHIQYNCAVESVQWSETRQKWSVNVVDRSPKIPSSEQKSFDKIVVAVGQLDAPFMPEIEGLAEFKGRVLHSMAYKNPAEFHNQKVVVVGFSNTAADTSTSLVGHAKSIYLSHRRGNVIMRRIVMGLPLDQHLTRRLSTVRALVTAFSPLRGQRILDSLAQAMSKSAFDGRLQPKWRFQPAPSLVSANPIVSESLVDELESANIESVEGIAKITGPNTIELKDGSTIEADAIVFCTGYKTTTRLKVPVEYDDDLHLPFLYQNVFHPQHPTSLAFMSFWETPTGICEIGDLLAMAIGQVFAGNYDLPPPKEMSKQIDRFHANLRCLQPLGFRHESKSKMSRQFYSNESSWRAFLHDAAGTRVEEHLGYRCEGWRYWVTNYRFCSLIMSNADSPHLYRLFPTRKGGPKRWSGAKEAIEVAYAEVDRYKKKLKAEQEGKKTQ